jgi:hypothetical protein
MGKEVDGATGFSRIMLGPTHACFLSTQPLINSSATGEKVKNRAWRRRRRRQVLSSRLVSGGPRKSAKHQKQGAALYTYMIMRTKTTHAGTIISFWAHTRGAIFFQGGRFVIKGGILRCALFLQGLCICAKVHAMRKCDFDTP